MLVLLAMGICTLAVWVFVRILRPGKFLLSDTPGRPNSLHVLHIFTVYFAYMIVGSLARLVVAALQGVKLTGDESAPMTVVLPATGAGLVVLIGGVILAASMTFPGGARRGLGFSTRRWFSDTGRGIVGFLAILPLCIAALKLTGYLIEKGVLPIEPTAHPALEFISRASTVWVVVVFVVITVLAPIGEELFFRGLVQSLLRRHLGGPWPAILATSAIFAAVHFNQPQAIPALFILAVAMGYNYERTGRLLGPIIMHAIFNAVMLWHVLG
jgi:membrane protease YdiL (CAAX protease family)